MNLDVVEEECRISASADHADGELLEASGSSEAASLLRHPVSVFFAPDGLVDYLAIEGHLTAAVLCEMTEEVNVSASAVVQTKAQWIERPADLRYLIVVRDVI